MQDTSRCILHPQPETDGFRTLAVPVYRASTIVFPDAATFAARGDLAPDGYTYGLHGTPTTRMLERSLSDLHGGVWTFLTPSGQAAVVLAMLAVLSAGDTVLIADTVYPPVRQFADLDLVRMGVTVRYFDPLSPEDVARQIDARTRLVWCESPGSNTMEVMDLPAITEIAHRHGALVGCDNTWATALNFKPLRHGVDFVAEALTKFHGGHADLLMGALTLRDEALILPLRNLIGRLGSGVSPDDAALVLRGMETMPLRLAHASAVALRLATRLAGHPVVHRVLHPALPGSPGHDVWLRDFTGSSPLFSVEFTPEATPHLDAALDGLQTFAIGASWGGTRSLLAPQPITGTRTARPWQGAAQILRFSIGLEAEDDLTRDIDHILDKLTAASADVRGAKHHRSAQTT